MYRHSGSIKTLPIRRNRYRACDFAYSHTFFRSVVCLSVVNDTRASCALKCHLAGALAGSNGI